jgi:hypothetical protein
LELPIRKLEMIYDVENIRQRYLQFIPQPFTMDCNEFAFTDAQWTAELPAAAHHEIGRPAFTVFAWQAIADDTFQYARRYARKYDRRLHPGAFDQHEKRSGLFGESAPQRRSAWLCRCLLMVNPRFKLLIDMGFRLFAASVTVEAFGR